MNHRKESTGIDNFGQFGHHWFTLIGGEALFNTTSGKAINFGWPKCGGFVPAPTPANPIHKVFVLSTNIDEIELSIKSEFDLLNTSKSTPLNLANPPDWVPAQIYPFLSVAIALIQLSRKQ